jgi:hypothetical protein
MYSPVGTSLKMDPVVERWMFTILIVDIVELDLTRRARLYTVELDLTRRARLYTVELDLTRRARLDYILSSSI